jgi:hypothetical protein
VGGQRRRFVERMRPIKLDLDCGSVARLYRLGSNNIRPVGNLK